MENQNNFLQNKYDKVILQGEYGIFKKSEFNRIYIPNISSCTLLIATSLENPKEKHSAKDFLVTHLDIYNLENSFFEEHFVEETFQKDVTTSLINNFIKSSKAKYLRFIVYIGNKKKDIKNVDDIVSKLKKDLLKSKKVKNIKIKLISNKKGIVSFYLSNNGKIQLKRGVNNITKEEIAIIQDYKKRLNLSDKRNFRNFENSSRKEIEACVKNRKPQCYLDKKRFENFNWENFVSKQKEEERKILNSFTN